MIANEELIVRLLRFVDPVFGYSKMSHAPTEFLALDDNIFDDIRRKRTDGMSEEHVKLVTQGKHMLKLLDQRLGPQHVQMARKVPSELTQGSTAGKIGEVVCMNLACLKNIVLSLFLDLLLQKHREASIQQGINYAHIYRLE